MPLIKCYFPPCSQPHTLFSQCSHPQSHLFLPYMYESLWTLHLTFILSKSRRRSKVSRQMQQPRPIFCSSQNKIPSVSIRGNIYRKAETVEQEMTCSTVSIYFLYLSSNTGMHRSGGAICHSRGHLTHLFDPNIAHGVHARNLCLHPVVDGNIAVLKFQLSV